MKYGFTRVALLSPRPILGAVSKNENELMRAINQSVKLGAEVILSGKLALSGYSCDTLFMSDSLLNKCLTSIESIANKTKQFNSLIIIGTPFKVDNCVYDCSAVLYKGVVCAIVPHRSENAVFSDYLGSKISYIDFGGRLKELSHDEKLCGNNIYINDYSNESSDTVKTYSVPFGTCIVFENTLLKYRMKFFDSCSPIDTEIVLRPLAKEKTLGSLSAERDIVRVYSMEHDCAVLSLSTAQSGCTNGKIYSDHKIIYELGKDIQIQGNSTGEGKVDGALLGFSEIDISGICYEKTVKSAQNNNLRQARCQDDCLKIRFASSSKEQVYVRTVNPYPLAPSNLDECSEVIDILTSGIHAKMRESSQEKLLLGLSGGLDSTNALLLCYHLFKRQNLPLENIIAVTMNSNHTSARTANNAKKLLKALGVSSLNIPISDAVKLHLKNISHSKMDVVYENAQARERTQILLSLANKHHALMIGTGDLSELALGFATFGGDLVSHFNPNGWLTKTAIRRLVAHFIETFNQSTETKNIAKILCDILDTPISPELLDNQSTESIIGRYELHDFFLHCLVGKGYDIEKTIFLATQAFKEYERKELTSTLEVFIRRFFKYRFKHANSDSPIAIAPLLSAQIKDIRSGITPELWLDDLMRLTLI